MYKNTGHMKHRQCINCSTVRGNHSKYVVFFKVVTSRDYLVPWYIDKS